MEKTIKIEMAYNKNINIYNENDLVLTIEAQNRKIYAEQIYNLLKFETGDKYKVEKINENNQDESVLDNLYNLINDICKEINKL